MTAPVLQVEIGFGSNWKTADADITWTDVTIYVLHAGRVKSDRGRSSELDEMRAGTAEFTLRNTDRRFDPSYTSGPHYGDLKPGVPVRFSATPTGQSEAPVYRGFVTGFPQEYDVSNKLAVVPVRCVDGFDKLSTAGLPSSVYAYEVAADAPDAWWRLTEDAGTIMGDSSGNALHGTYEGGVTFYSYSHPNRYETESGLSFPVEASASNTWGGDTEVTIGSTHPVTVEFIGQVKDDPDSVGKFDVFAVDQTPSNAGFRVLIGRTGAGGVTDPYFAILTQGGSAPNAQTSAAIDITEPHHYAARWVNDTTVALYIDGVAVATGAASLGSLSLTDDFLHWVSFGATIADLAVWESDIGTSAIATHADAFLAPWDGDATGTRIGRLLDAVGWPAGLRDLETGDSTLGPAVFDGNCLRLAKKVEHAEQGWLFITKAGSVRFLNRYFFTTESTSSTSQATISDDGSDHPYSSFAYDYDTSLVLNRVRGKRPGGALVEAFDSDSIDNYGEQVDEQLEGAALPTDGAMADAVNHRLALYKEPALRARPIRIPLHRLTAAQQATLLGLELGHRVTVERTPQGVGTQVSTSSLVQHIEHNAGNGEWWLTLTTSPTTSDVFGILDDDTESVALARLESDGSELAAGIDNDDTSLSVAVASGPLWTTDADYCPFNIYVDSEEMTVTAVSGGASPQTFTVTRLGNAVAHDAAAPVTLVKPFVLIF